MAVYCRSAVLSILHRLLDHRRIICFVRCVFVLVIDLVFDVVVVAILYENIRERPFHLLLCLILSIEPIHSIFMIDPILS